MSDVIKEFEKIKVKLEAAQSKRDVLKGKSEAAMDDLKKYGFDSINKASKSLVKLGKEADKVSEELEDLIKAFNEKFPELSVDADE